MIANVETENAAVQALLERMIQDPEPPVEDIVDEESREVNVPEAFQVVVECRDEADQQVVYERLSGEGYKCKLLTL